MALFLSTYTNKVDKKGRVSVPARYRAELARQGFEGIILFPSYAHQAIEACGMDFLNSLQERLGAFDPFDEVRDDLASSIMSDSVELSFDGEGRIIMPGWLMEHAAITGHAAFVGQGDRFQIWEPEAAAAFKRQSRERALRHRGRLKPNGGPSDD